MFLLYTLRDVIFADKSFREYYVNDLHTTSCSGVLGHRSSLSSTSAGYGGVVIRRLKILGVR